MGVNLITPDQNISQAFIFLFFLLFTVSFILWVFILQETLLTRVKSLYCTVLRLQRLAYFTRFI